MIKSLLARWRKFPKSQRVMFGVGVPAVAVAAVVNRSRGEAPTAAEPASVAAVPPGGRVFDPGAVGVAASEVANFANLFTDEVAGIESRLEVVEGKRAKEQAQSPEDTDMVDRSGISQGSPIFPRPAVPVTVVDAGGVVRRGQLPPVHLDPDPLLRRPPEQVGRRSDAIRDRAMRRARVVSVSQPPRSIKPPKVTALPAAILRPKTVRRVPDPPQSPRRARVVRPWLGVR